MRKRIIRLLAAVMLMACLMPLGKGAVHAAQSDHQAQIERMNALLNGLSLSSLFTQKEAAQWSDETIVNAIHSKLCWYWQFSDYTYTGKFMVNPEDFSTYKLSGLDELARSCYGRGFPQNINSDYMDIDGDRVYVHLAAGESTTLSVQDYYVCGDRVTAVGVEVYRGGAMSSVGGYFQAEMQKNENSIYGYTLISLKEIQGNQDFSGLTATASSELKESTVTHYAQRVLDGKLGTAWVEAARGVGIGEWIQIFTASGEKLELIGIDLNLGYQLDQRRLDNNGWPTELLIECEGGYIQKAELYYYDSVILLDTPVKTSWVKLTILDAEPGEKFEDTCISEIRLLGLDFEQMVPEERPQPTQPPATTPKPTQPPATTPQPTQPPVTTPQPTQPAKPQVTAPQGQSSGGQTNSGKKTSSSEDNKIVMIAIIAVIVITAVAGATMLMTARKNTSAPQKANDSGYPQRYQPPRPQGPAQSAQNPPQNPPKNPGDYPQKTQQSSLLDEPKNPWQQGRR